MPRTAGTYALPAGSTATPSTTIESAKYNAALVDIASALTDSINKDGTKAFAADQPFGGYKATNIAVGTARTDAAQLGQVQDGKANWVAAGGTADAITATYSPAITALVDGQECTFRASAANATTTPTFAPNGLTARTIVKRGGSALAAGDIPGAAAEVVLKYNLANTRWELINPTVSAVTASTTTEVLTGTATGNFVTPDALAALWEAGSNITGGATIVVGEGGYFQLNASTTAITAITVTTDKAGRTFRFRFNTVRTLTHNATSLILPGGANITTAVGDIAQFRSLGSGNVVCEWYTRGSGLPVVSPTVNTPTTIIKGTADARTSTTLANDTDFTFSMLANTNYVIRGRFYLTNTSTGGAKIGLSGPASPTSALLTATAASAGDSASYDWTTTAGVTTSSTGSVTLVNTNPGSTIAGVIDFEVVWNNGSNAGTFVIQTAQGSNNGTTTFAANSTMSYVVV